MYRIGCTKPTTLPNRPYVSSGLIYHSAYGNIHPTNLMTKQWICPSTKHNVVFSNNNEHYFPDSLYSEIQIYTHPEGIGTTYLNGQLIPSSSFELFPNTNGAYYVAQLPYFNEEIPDVVCIENENGFSAYLREFAYNKVDNVYNYFSGDIFDVLYYYASASGCNYLSLPYAHTNLSPNFGLVNRCLGDTLALHVEHNPDSVPVEWIVDGTSHLGDVGHAYRAVRAALRVSRHDDDVRGGGAAAAHHRRARHHRVRRRDPLRGAARCPFLPLEQRRDHALHHGGFRGDVPGERHQHRVPRRERQLPREPLRAVGGGFRQRQYPLRAGLATAGRHAAAPRAVLLAGREHQHDLHGLSGRRLLGGHHGPLPRGERHDQYRLPQRFHGQPRPGHAAV